MRHRDLAVALLLAAVAGCAGAMVFVPGVTGVFHDDAVYVSTAEALATGRGYRLIDIPGEPFQTKYPIGYPLVLAVIWWFSSTPGMAVLSMQIITLLCSAATAALAYLYVVKFRYVSPSEATLGVAIAATTPFLSYLSSLTLSEGLFGLLVIAALWRLDSTLVQSSPGRLNQFVTGVVLALPYNCRSAGGVVLCAAVLVLMSHRQQITWLLVGAAGVALPWAAWSLLGTGTWSADPIAGYYTDYVGAWSSLALPSLGRVIVWNTLSLAHALAALPLAGLLRLLPSQSGAALLLLAIGGAMLVGFARLCRGVKPLAVFLALYLVVIVVWPWPPARFVVPVLAVALPLAIGQLRTLLTRRGDVRRWRRVLAVAACAVVACNVWSLSLAGSQNRAYHYPYYSPPLRPAHWRSFEEVFDWIRSQTPHDAVIASPLDSMLARYTGRKAFRPFPHRPDRLFYGAPGPATGSVDDLVEALRRGGATHIVLMPMFQFAEELPFTELIGAALAQKPGLLTRRHEGADPRFVVFEVRGVHTDRPP